MSHPCRSKDVAEFTIAVQSGIIPIPRPQMQREPTMQIQPDLIRRLRTQRHWSQEQLAEASGLNLRTIQRLEAGSRASLESVRALAAVFEIDAAALTADEEGSASVTPIDRVRDGLNRLTDFEGRSSRADYWWLFLIIVMLAAIAAAIGELFGELFGAGLRDGLARLVFVVFLLPLLAAGTRRLRDAGHSVWWQLMFLVPFGFVVPFYLMALPTASGFPDQQASAG